MIFFLVLTHPVYPFMLNEKLPNKDHGQLHFWNKKTQNQPNQNHPPNPGAENPPTNIPLEINLTETSIIYQVQ